jgi:hypothetical protein
METKFLLHNKIIWNGKISNDLSTSFYPSFYKDILKREKVFSENFRYSFEDATVENLKNKFIPLYQKEIISREDFTLEKDTIVESLIQRVEKNPSKYKFLFIHDNTGELYGAMMFSILEHKLLMAFKAYRRDIKISALKHKASLDYWGEKLLREYSTRLGLKIFSYGRDTHPYVGLGRIGLALYKLKAGTKPMVPNLNNPEKPVEITTVNDSFFLSQKKPIVFFSNPGDDDFYQNCFLYCPKNSIHESFINEFRVVSEWAGITFESIEY